MDQNLNDSQASLWALLANPADNPYSYANNSQQLVDNFPQSAILQALLAHTSIEKNLKQASVYYNAKLLYKLINNPSTFNEVPDDRIIVESGLGTIAHNNEPSSSGENVFAIPDENTSGGENEYYFNDNSAVDTGELTETESHHNGEVYKNHTAETLPDIEYDSPVEEQAAESPADELRDTDNETAALATESTENYTSDIIEDNNETVAAPKEELFTPVGHEDTEIEEEVFDEIVGIEQIDLGRSASDYDLSEDEEARAPEVESNTAGLTGETEGYEEEKLANEFIGSNDFFSFERAFTPEDSVQTDDEQTELVENGQPQQAEKSESAAKEFYFGERQIRLADDAAQRDVSKYYDEKMPYSFMWWLDRTRREHAGLYQPYIKSGTKFAFNKAKRPGDELQQQYYENIFHITSLEELDKSTAGQIPNFNIKRKEQKIIDRFIQEDPQIKPQSSEKIDNENKAKKSSEDADELVSETLAHIYAEQMLYHKAIASYKKLMLKFPEKSRYFADKIEQIEKKIN